MEYGTTVQCEASQGWRDAQICISVFTIFKGNRKREGELSGLNCALVVQLFDR